MRNLTYFILEKTTITERYLLILRFKYENTLMNIEGINRCLKRCLILKGWCLNHTEENFDLLTL
jgi:hypothetical protein